MNIPTIYPCFLSPGTGHWYRLRVVQSAPNLTRAKWSRSLPREGQNLVLRIGDLASILCQNVCVLWSFSFMAAVTKWYPLVFCVKCEKIHSKYVNAIILTSRFTKTLCSWNHKKSQQPIILSKNPFIIRDRSKNYQVPGYCSGKF